MKWQYMDVVLIQLEQPDSANVLETGRLMKLQDMKDSAEVLALEALYISQTEQMNVIQQQMLTPLMIYFLISLDAFMKIVQ